MPRAVWSGSISFGLVNIPVKLYSAISEKNVRFNQLDRRNGARVKQQRVNAETGEEVGWDDIVKGYEVSKGNYIVMTDDELASFSPEATHTIDLECFVDLDEIDPIYFDGAYHVAPAMAAKPYALLVQAMEASNKVAIAKFVMRSKQYLAALRPKDGTLLLSMMVYADEITDTGEISEFEDVAAVKIEKKELAMADQLIASLSETFDPEMFHDTYREQVLELIDRKAGGEQIVAQVTAPPSADKVIDLMAALEASVKAAKGARGRHPTALASVDGVDAGEDMGEDIGEDIDEDDSLTKPARKAAARKTPAKKVAAKATPAKPDAAKRTRKSA